VKTRDLFAGCSVLITRHDEVWLVSLNTDDLSKIVMNTYLELPDALESGSTFDPSFFRYGGPKSSLSFSVML
jgi:hypothetical protein